MRTFITLALVGIATALRLRESDPTQDPNVDDTTHDIDDGSHDEMETRYYSTGDIVNWLFDHIDSDGDDRLSRDEGMDALRLIAGVIVDRGLLYEMPSDWELRELQDQIRVRADENEDGHLSREEFGEAISVIADLVQWTAEDFAEVIVWFADYNYDGEIDMEEVRAFLAELGLEVSDDDLMAFAAQLDVDQSGGVSADEIADWFDENEFEGWDPVESTIHDWAFNLIDWDMTDHVERWELEDAVWQLIDAAWRNGLLDFSDVEDEWDFFFMIEDEIDYIGRKADLDWSGGVDRSEWDVVFDYLMDRIYGAGECEDGECNMAQSISKVTSDTKLKPSYSKGEFNLAQMNRRGQTRPSTR